MAGAPVIDLSRYVFEALRNDEEFILYRGQSKEQCISGSCRTFDINVWGVLNSMKHEIAAMLKTEGGAIVNTSSVAGHIGLPQASLYVATKHAVEGLTKAVALEFARQGIRVNSVAPGTIATDMVDRMVGQAGDARNWLLSLHPIGRFGASEEIAAAVLYLASDAEVYHRQHAVDRRRMDRSVIGATTEKELMK